MRIQRNNIPWLLMCGLLVLTHPAHAKVTLLELVTQLSLDTTRDTDGDLLSDGIELSLFGTLPNLIDSDGDGQSDFFEALIAGNPLSEISPPPVNNRNIELIAEFDLDTSGDADQDGLSDGLERIQLGLDPLLADSDGDGELDFVEILRGLNALSPDIPAPIARTLELVAALTIDTTQDADGDGLTDGLETHLLFTSPTLADTDFDGVLDFREILLQENPFSKLKVLVSRTLEVLAQLQLDTTVDRDQDGLSDGVERHITFTDFRLVDTDGDNTPDNVEVLLGTNPFFHAQPPVDLRPIIQVGRSDNNTLNLFIDAAGAKLIAIEATNDFIEWQSIATITVDENDPNSPSVAIPTDTDHAFFRIIKIE